MQHAQQEFLKTIETNKRLIFKICNSYCQNTDDREDLAQEIIFQLWKSWGNFNNDYKLSTWMYRIALNVAISFYRTAKKTTNTISMGEHLIEIVDENCSKGMPLAEEGLEENLNALQKFINELRPLDKALMLLYLEEKSHKEIAEIIGITSTNVATKIGRIKEQLKQKFSTQN